MAPAVADTTFVIFRVAPNGTIECLLQLRDSHLPLDRYPNCWGLLGGRVIPDETIVASVVREIREETGITVTYDDVWRIGQYQHDGVCDDIFLVEFSPHHTVECHEGQMMAWKPFVALAALPLAFGQREILPLVTVALHARGHRT